MRLAIALLCLVFALPAIAQDGGAVLVNTFNLEELPYRDLAISCGDGLHLFGDTYASLSPVSGWRPNTAGRLVNGRLTAVNGDALLWPPDADAVVSVPSGCARYGGVYVGFYTDAASNTGHDFAATSSGVVLSSDGAAWVKYRLWNGDGDRAQAALVVSDGYLYMLMSGAGRVGAATLARTDNPTNVESYTWWDGTGWGIYESAVAIINGQVGESSLCFDGALWHVAYLDPSYNAVITRTAPALMGVWGEASVLVDWGLVHGVYSPQWVNCGRSFLLSHFENSTIGGLTWPAYNVYEWQVN